MADKEKAAATVEGYHGTGPTGPFEVPEDAPEGSVASPAGVTPPTIEYGGDGTTPVSEWREKYAKLKKEQDEKDRIRRELATEEGSGTVLTTEDKLARLKGKGKNG